MNKNERDGLRLTIEKLKEENSVLKAELSDAKHLLSLSRRELGCEDEPSPEPYLVPDAECLRQLVVKTRAALAELAITVDYDKWMCKLCGRRSDRAENIRHTESCLLR